jgi:hypothetical protein
MSTGFAALHRIERRQSPSAGGSALPSAGGGAGLDRAVSAGVAILGLIAASRDLNASPHQESRLIRRTLRPAPALRTRIDAESQRLLDDVGVETDPCPQPRSDVRLVDLAGGDREHLVFGVVDVRRIRIPGAFVQVDEHHE